MSLHEIDPSITSPTPNEAYVRESILMSRLSIETIVELLRIVGVNRKKYKTVMDLGAGDGGMAFILQQYFQFKAEQIICVDKCQPNPPMIAGCRWQFWDIRTIADAVMQNQNPSFIPAVRDLKNTIDMVTCNDLGRFYDFDPLPAAYYFLKPEGLLYINNGEPKGNKNWEAVKWKNGDPFECFFRKII